MPTVRAHRIDPYTFEWKTGNKVWNSGPLSKNTFKSARLAGVEWEYNRIQAKNDPYYEWDTLDGIKPVKDWARKWYGGHHYDGSCGNEIVTAPMAGDNIAKCLTELHKAMTTDSLIEVDKRCSVHVHIGVKDFEWDDMYRLVELYSKFEKLLYVIGGDSRYGNDYCSPCGDGYTKALKERGEVKKEKLLAVTFREGPRARATQTRTAIEWANRCRKKDGGRYKGLNIIPWIVAKRDDRKDCTVEFRIHENTTDANRVIGWVHLLVRFVDWCKKAKRKQITELPKNQIKALIQMCPESEDFIKSRIIEWKKLPNKTLHYNRGVFVKATAATKKKEEVLDYETAPITGRRSSSPGHLENLISQWVSTNMIYTSITPLTGASV